MTLSCTVEDDGYKKMKRESLVVILHTPAGKIRKETEKSEFIHTFARTGKVRKDALYPS